eukprot:11321207-Alexandrium_andersonii.AAC.1
MSASLVGSEMCIRDSPSELSPLPRSLLFSTPAVPHCVARAAGARAAARAVSYTHLTLPTICSV